MIVFFFGDILIKYSVAVAKSIDITKIFQQIYLGEISK